MTIRLHSFVEPVENFYAHLGPLSIRRRPDHETRLDTALDKHEKSVQDLVVIQTTPLRSGGDTLGFATQQILMMQGVEHENLTRFLGSFYSIDVMELSIVSEFMDGKSLAEVVESSAPLAENVIASITLQVCSSTPKTVPL